MATRRSTFAKGRWTDSRSINAIVSDYRAFVGVVEHEAMRIMGRAAEMQLEMTLPFVPRETGALQESGKAQAIRTSKGVAAIVSFGGPGNPVKPTKNAPTGIVNYAAVVNYDMETQRQSGEPLFLEKGAAASKDAVDAYIMSELRKIKP